MTYFDRRYFYSPPGPHLTGKNVYSCMEVMLFFPTEMEQSGEKPMPTLHTAPSHLSEDLNKDEKHKSNLDIQVATALVSHAAQD